MSRISSTAFDALRGQLGTAAVHTPDSQGYKESLARWSDTGMKQAVGKRNLKVEFTD